MADDNKLSGKAGLDSTDFKTNVAGMNRELRVLESGFRASAASLGDWANDATGLEKRIDSLNSQLDIQKQKVAATRAEYERIKAEKGENSRAAQDLEIKLNKETETLGKMENELGNTESALEEMRSSSDDAGDSVDEAGDNAEEAGGKFEGFGAVLGGIGAVVAGAVALIAGLALAVIGVAKSISDLVFGAADAAAQLVDMSAKTGISTTRLQELDFIAGQTGTSLDTITGANARLIRSMFSATEQASDYEKRLADAAASGKDIEDIELGDLGKAFQTLGVSVTDASGNLRDNQEVFDDVIDALGRIENPAQRDALAMQIFGKSAQELNPLIKTGADEMANMAKQAHEVGAVMSEEDVAALEAFDDTLASMEAGLKGTLGTLAGAFLPGFQAVFDQVGGYLKTFTDIVSGADGDFGKMAKGLTGLVTEIATDIAEQAPQMLEAGLAIVQSILDAIIAALPQMLTAGVAILMSLINFIVQALPTLIQAGVQILLTLVTAIIQNLPMLINAALQAVITLANGLAAALPTLIPAVVEAIITIVNTLIENIPMLINAALTLILALAQGLIIALPVLIAALPVIIDALLNALIDALPMIFDMAGQIIGMLATGIVAAIPVLLVGVGELIVRLGNTLARFIETLPDVGRGFIQGLIDGVKSAAGLLYEAVAAIIQNMIATITGGLVMQSPSAVGKGIGKNFIGSIALGGQETMQAVERAFFSMTGRLALAAAGGVGGSSSAQNIRNDNSFDIWGNVIIQGDTPAGSLGASLKGKRF